MEDDEEDNGYTFLLVRIYWRFGKQMSNLCIWAILKSMLRYQELPQELHVSVNVYLEGKKSYLSRENSVLTVST